MRRFTRALAITLLCAAPALAQEKIFRSVDAAPGKQVRLALVGNVSKECSPGPKPDVKVLTAPKHGILAIRSGKTKPGSLARCPNLAVPAEGIFYTANANFSGTDEVVYGVTRSDGRNELVTVKIAVGGAAKSDKPDAQSRTGADL